MKIDVSEAVLCDCDTLCTQETEPANVIIDSSVQPLCTQETEPSNVIDSSVQLLGSTSDQSSETEPPLVAPPVTTSVDAEPTESVDAPADASATASPSTSSSPSISSFPPQPAQPLGPTASLAGPAFSSSISSSRKANIFGSGASNASVSSTFGSMQAPRFGSGSSAASRPSTFWSMQAPTFGSGSSSSTSSPFDAPSPLRRESMQPNGPNTSSPFSFLPAQDSGKTASAFPPPFSYPARPHVGLSPTAPSGYFGENHFSTPKNPFGSYLHPGFGVSYPPNPFGQTITPVCGRSVGTEQGSRYPRYAPTPDLDYSGGQGKLIISISASNSHGHKSHEELRWEDYKNGDKGGFGWFPPAYTVSPSLFDYPSIPEIIGPTQRNMTGFPFGYTIPTAVQRPHEPAGVASPASGCTACGATSSSSPSRPLGLNGTINPPLVATTLPGLFISTYGSFPLMFGALNLAAYGTTTTTPAVQAYVMIFGTNFTSQGITPAVQAYPMMFGTPNLVGQGTTTTPAAQPYPTMFGTPNLAGQGTSTPPAFQAYPTMFGTPNLAAQGTSTTPPAQPYPTLFGTTNLAGQGTSTPPAFQAYPTMFGTPTSTTPPAQPYPTLFGTTNLAGQGLTPAPQPYRTVFGTPNLAGQGTTTPAAQPYPTMFGTSNLAAQGTLVAQASPIHGSTLLPFAAMSLQ